MLTDLLFCYIVYPKSKLHYWNDTLTQGRKERYKHNKFKHVMQEYYTILFIQEYWKKIRQFAE